MQDESYMPCKSTASQRSKMSHQSRSSKVLEPQQDERPGSRKFFLQNLAAQRRHQDELDKKKIEKTVQLKKDADEKNLGKLSNRVKASMHFLDGVDRDLNLVDETKRTKIRRQYEGWNANVHGEIQKHIVAACTKLTSKELHEKKLSAYDKFLSITNRKPVIARSLPNTFTAKTKH